MLDSSPSQEPLTAPTPMDSTRKWLPAAQEAAPAAKTWPSVDGSLAITPPPAPICLTDVCRGPVAALDLLGERDQSTHGPVGPITIRGFSAGSFSGLLLHRVLQLGLPQVPGLTCLAAIACPPHLFQATCFVKGSRRLHLIHLREDNMCEWRPLASVLRALQESRAWLTLLQGVGNLMRGAHGYSHLVFCPDLPNDIVELAELEQTVLAAIPLHLRLAPLYACLSVCRLSLDVDQIAEQYPSWRLGGESACQAVAPVPVSYTHLRAHET